MLATEFRHDLVLIVRDVRPLPWYDLVHGQEDVDGLLGRKGGVGISTDRLAQNTPQQAQTVGVPLAPNSFGLLVPR